MRTRVRPRQSAMRINPTSRLLIVAILLIPWILLRLVEYAAELFRLA